MQEILEFKLRGRVISVRIPERIAIVLFVGLIAAPAWAGSLHEAVRDGDSAAAERLIAAGADVEALDDAALTPLVTAALAGHNETVVLLIDKGADLRGRDGNGFTALHAAAHAGHLDVVNLLINHGVDINDQQNTAKITPLHAAAERDFREIAEVLLDQGATMDLKSLTGHTPVVMATLKGHAEMVKLLRDHGANCSKIRSKRFREYCMNAGT